MFICAAAVFFSLGLFSESLQQVSPWAYAPATIAAIFAGVASIVGTIVTHRKSVENGQELAKVKKTGEATHTLTNSAMGAQLLTTVELLQAQAVQAHRIAALTHEDADEATAEALEVKVKAAQEVYQKHMTNQAIVDAKSKP